MIFRVSVWYAEPSLTFPGDLWPWLPPVLAPPPPPPPAPPVLAPPPLRLSFLPARTQRSPRLAGVGSLVPGRRAPATPWRHDTEERALDAAGRAAEAVARTPRTEGNEHTEAMCRCMGVRKGA